ncbi:DUF1311 domain-containing protein [Massilia sp. CCM 8733]|uniref:DUF1311 domain-containing protein n=1 Tax=Massilia mucilaginosa TaxID=2609282 RepID=A0ABX0P2B2_9BURK|nr:lysozyme inhibitor LprI family protein [Massilia mucilaginosa]NHZ93459.1 DUF1311 domain-containing protein [Massilia mucilaginosa]
MKTMLLSIALLGAAQARAEAPMNQWLVAAVAKEMGKPVSEIRNSVAAKTCEGRIGPMEECMSVKLAAREIRMRTQYARAQKRLPHARDRDKLAMAQQAWIIFRGASCDYEARTIDDGRSYGVEESACKSSMTEARINTLRAYAECGSDAC